MSKPIALIIEDNDDLAIIFAETLKDAGFETENIVDGAVARERLKGDPPALITLDLHLPNVSGDELLADIKADPRYENTRIIILSADAALSSELEEQVDVVLLKPVGFDQLSMLATRLAGGSSD